MSSTCPTCPISASLHSLAGRFIDKSRRLGPPADGAGLGSLLVIGLASAVLAMATVSSLVAIAGPLIDLMPDLVSVVAAR